MCSVSPKFSHKAQLPILSTRSPKLQGDICLRAPSCREAASPRKNALKEMPKSNYI